MKFLESTDPSYYMEEGCGIFAIALSNLKPGGEIGIISRNYGEPWSDSIPYEVTHVFYRTNGQLYDCKGPRSAQDMAADFHASDFSIKGGWDPKSFKTKFMGPSDSKPLYSGNSEIKEAQAYIKSHADLFGLG